MKAYTLQPMTVRPTQAIKDALNLPAETPHVRWLIAAPNHNQVVYQMRAVGDRACPRAVSVHPR